MGKNWIYSIAWACASIGVTVAYAVNATPLAAQENPLSKYLARQQNSSGNTSSVFGTPSPKKVPLNQRVAGALKNNPISDAISSFARRSAKMLTPKPRVDRAVDPLSLFAESPSPSSELYVALAKASEFQKRTDKAEEFYKKALGVDPENFDAISGYAHLLDQQGRFGMATRFYLQITNRYPDQASTHNDLGLCYARQDMLSQAIDSLDRAVTLQPKRKLYRNNIATVLIEVDRASEALGHLTAVHGVAIAHYNVGYLLHMQGDDRLAVTHFSEALQFNPSLTAAQDWFDRLGGQPVDRIVLKPTVEVTDLPEVEDTSVDDVAVRRVAPRPAPIVPYAQQPQSKNLAPPREAQAFAPDRAVAPPTSSPSSVSRPAVSLPAESPPTDSLPIVSPPVVSSPMISPLAVSPPIVPPPAVSPPTNSLPIVLPSAVSPPPVAPAPVPLPAVSPPTDSLPIVLPSAASPPPYSPPPALTPPVVPAPVSPPTDSLRIVLPSAVSPSPVSPSPVSPPPVAPTPVLAPPVLSPTASRTSASLSPNSPTEKSPTPVLAPAISRPSSSTPSVSLPSVALPSSLKKAPIESSDVGIAGHGALPPSPNQVYRYQMTAPTQPLPPVPKN